MSLCLSPWGSSAGQNHWPPHRSRRQWRQWTHRWRSPRRGRKKKLLQEQLEERINALVASHLRQLEVEIRAEIKNTLQAQRHRFFERSDPE